MLDSLIGVLLNRRGMRSAGIEATLCRRFAIDFAFLTARGGPLGGDAECGESGGCCGGGASGTGDVEGLFSIGGVIGTGVGELTIPVEGSWSFSQALTLSSRLSVSWGSHDGRSLCLVWLSSWLVGVAADW